MCVCHRHTRTCTYTLICVWEREGQIHHYTMKITSIIHTVIFFADGFSIYGKNVLRSNLRGHF